MELPLKADCEKRVNSDGSNCKEEIVVKEENIELEIDPSSLCDEGIETDYESEEKFQIIDYANWYKFPTADFTRDLTFPSEQEKDEAFFNYNPLGDLALQSFVCFYCGELWNDKVGLKFHIKDIHMAEQSTKPSNKGFECSYCRRKFKEIKRLVAHTERKHKQKEKIKKGKNIKAGKAKKKPFVCQFCNYRAEHRCLVNYHVRRVHEKIKPYQCPHCHFRSAYSHAIRNHIESKHISSEPNRVKRSVYDVCGDRFIQSLNHRFQVMLKQNDLKPYACSKCDYRANRPNILENHIRSKHEMIPYDCPKCDFKTNLKKNLSIHIALTHKRLKPCKSFEIKPENTKVNLIKEPKKERIYNCPLCDFKSSRFADIRYHMKTFHEKRNLYHCPHCNFDFYDVSEMKSHIALAHGTVSTLYSCAHCDFVSYNLEELKSHATAEHGKVQLYYCPYCEFKCVQKEKLEIHKSLQHKNIY